MPLPPERADWDSPEKWDFPDYYRLVPEKYLRARLSRLAELLRDRGLKGFLTTHNTDFYYLTGTMQQGVLFVRDNAEPHVFLRRHAGRGLAETPLKAQAVQGLTEVARTLGGILGGGAGIGVAMDVLSARDYLGWLKRLPNAELVDVTGPWLGLKGVKDEFERELMTETGLLAAKMFALLPDLIRPGVSEGHLSGQMVAYGLARGHIDLMRTRSQFMENYGWHLGSGPEGLLPSSVDAAASGYGPTPAFPQGSSQKVIRPHEPIMVDVGACLHGYQTDQTRTYTLGGAPDEMHRAYVCLMAMDKALAAALKPGAVSGELFDLAQSVAAEHGMTDGFLGWPGHRIRFVGHGLGLELGSPPYLLEGSKEKVLAHQAYALELKMALACGPVGYENTYLVNPEGPPSLITPIPERPYEVPL